MLRNGSTPTLPAMRHFLLTLAVLLCACPGFEDQYSGTYQQVLGAGDEGTEPIEVEIFRYGHNVQAIVRFFADEADPFSRETRCALTDPAVLSDDDTFEVLVRNSTPQVRLAGRFEGGGRLKARINAAGGNSPDLALKLLSSTPDDTCRTIPPRSVTAKFGGLSATNEFEPGEYEIENPYFGIQWIAVQPIQTGTIEVWTAFTPDLVFAPVQSKVTSNRRGLTGELTLRVEPPADDYRTVSGDTRYSLAHFIVVDDDPEDSSFVTWDRTTEPIIASGVRAGKRPDAPDFVEDHNQFGLALLFVEGRLDDLGNMLDIIEIEDGVDPTEHFYVAQVFAAEERVVGLRISKSTVLTIPVTVTTDYLNETTLPLPRLFPVD